MKRWLPFLIAAVVTFGVTLAGTGRANWYVNATPVMSCKSWAGLPQFDMFGGFYTNDGSQPVGDTFYGYLSCFYQDHLTNEFTGALNPQIDMAQLTVYDGDPTYDTWGLHRYDVRAALCLQDYYQTIFWCSSNTTTTNWIGWQTINFWGPGSGWSGDMPPVWNDKGWGDSMLGFSRIIYVFMPQLSKFTGWNVGNPTWPG